MSLQLVRMLDANLNRAREGLRVVEDWFRFMREADLAERWRALRHRFSTLEARLREQVSDVPFQRAVEDDPGRENPSRAYAGELEVLQANLSRIKSAIRVVEEVCRALAPGDLVGEWQAMRFAVYEMESDSLGRTTVRRLEGLNLYLIFDLDLVYEQGMDPFDLGKALVEAGVDILQFRFSEKVPDRTVLSLIEELRPFVDNTLLFVNNRPDIAYLTGLHLHLGQKDIPPAQARRIVGWGRIIGQSCHSDEEVNRAQEDRAVDYFTMGPVFPTRTKPDYTPVGTGLVERWYNRAGKRFVLIGGINADRMVGLLGYRPWAVAVCRDILLAEDPVRRVREYKEKMRIDDAD